MNKKQRTELTGLSIFITNIRKCRSKEDEIKRVNKELANIRSKFAENKILEGYQKKKYVCKLIYIFLLGHNFDFGFIEAINLMSSTKYSEKFMGYLFASIFMNEKSNLMRLVVRTLESDLVSNVPENQNIALKYIANMASKSIAEELGDIVLGLLFRSDATDAIKQTALLSLLAVYKIKPDVIPEKDYPLRILSFLSHQNVGIVTAAASLIENLVKDGRVDVNIFRSNVICRLNRLVRTHCLEAFEYNFYFACAPWLSVKLMRLLRYCDYPSEDILKTRLFETLDVIFNKVQERPKSKKLENRFTKYILVLEAVHLVRDMKLHEYHRARACSSLDICLVQREPNLRFLALECMKILCECEPTKERYRKQLDSIIKAMNKETDSCIREKAADLLCDLCDGQNYKDIILEMFEYLDTSTPSEKEKTILKIYLLTEKHYSNPKWYVDTVMDLVYAGGEFVRKEVWYRFVQFVINHPSMQGYAAKRAFEIMHSSNFNENVVILAGYILGEFGNLIAGDKRSKPITQLNLLQNRFHFSTCETRALLLTTYVKFANLFPEIKKTIKDIFRNFSDHPITEIQQRAVEYLNLLEVLSNNQLATVLEEMPNFKKQKPIIERALSEIKSKELGNLLKVKDPLIDVTDSETTPSYLALYDEPKTDKPERRITTPSMNAGISNVDILANAFSHTNIFTVNQISLQRSVSTAVVSSQCEDRMDFIWNKSGTLYESNILQVYFDSQFTRHRGHIRFKYFNKSNNSIVSFLAHLPFENYLHQWSFVIHPCSTTIAPKSEVEQNLTVECLKYFTHMPSLSLSFISSGSHQVVPIQIPMTLNKFIEESPMSCDEFKVTWDTDILRQNQVTKSFPAKYLFNKNILEKKLRGFGMAILTNDQDPKTFLCSGVFYSRLSLVGIMLQLQPLYQDYNLTVRSIEKQVTEEVLRLIESII